MDNITDDMFENAMIEYLNMSINYIQLLYKANIKIIDVFEFELNKYMKTINSNTLIIMLIDIINKDMMNDKDYTLYLYGDKLLIDVIVFKQYYRKKQIENIL